MKVNYKSDFKITEVLKQSLVGIPFTFTYYVGDKQQSVTFDGENYDGCSLVSGKKNVLQVVFDNHNFGCGQLRCHRVFDIPDTDYTDGKRHMEFDDEINVVLVKGNGDQELNLTNYLVPSFLKPVRGQDYWTEADEEEIIADTKSSILADTEFVSNLQNKVNSTEFQSTLKTETAETLEADEEFNTTLQNATIEALEANSDFKGAIADTTIASLEASSDFKSSIKSSVSDALKDDNTFLSLISAGVNTETFRTVIANALATDAAFVKAVKEAIENLPSDAENEE